MFLQPKKISRARRVALMMFALGTGAMLTPSAPVNSALISSAEARVGRSRGGGGMGSFGSRGSRSFNPGAGTTRMQPLPSTQGRDPRAGIGAARTSPGARNTAPNRGSWLSRNPMLGMIGAALAGTVLGSLLMNAFSGLGAFGPILMMILFAGLLFGLFAMIRVFMGRKKVAMAGNTPRFPTSIGAPNLEKARPMPYSSPEPSQTPQSREGYLSESPYPSGPDSNQQTRDQGLAAIALEDRTMTQERLTDALSSRFFQIQEAWTQGDRQTLQNTLTGELNQEFGAELSDLERRGERNILKNIVIRGFDISEAWQEGENEFVTAHISARLLDYNEKNGRVVSGDAQNPTNFSEFWTFVRMRGRGDWILSAINQEA